MDDELADARRKGSQRLQVVLNPLLVRVASVELDEAIEHR